MNMVGALIYSHNWGSSGSGGSDRLVYLVGCLSRKVRQIGPPASFLISEGNHT